MSEAWGPRGRPERCSDDVRRDEQRMERTVWLSIWLVTVLMALVVFWWG